MKLGIVGTLLSLTLWTQAFAAPTVAQMAVTTDGGFQLTLVADAEPVQTVALEVRDAKSGTWRNVAVWDWNETCTPGSSQDFSAPATAAHLEGEYRVLFFGERGLVKLQTLTPEPELGEDNVG